MDAALRSSWAKSAPRSGHLDEAGWRLFLENGLDATTRESTREHIASCPSCAGVFKAARLAAVEHLPEEASGQTKAIRQLPHFATIGALVVVVLALFLGRPAEAPNLPAVATGPSANAIAQGKPSFAKAPVVLSAEQPLATRDPGRVGTFVKELTSALEPYERDAFAEAATRLERLAIAHPKSFEAAFYQGVSLLMDGRAQESVPVLERADSLAGAARQVESRRWLEAARAAASAQ